ncbi:S8 family serine peptidase [Mesorhizobium australicum]|uniref:S8 family peptidase n=1 Tax=Mesorhizobium TaxID=68287 RepID=UPI0018DBC893|nr:S8 family serine peptidase [Mesorhizobium sp. LNHC209A00]
MVVLQFRAVFVMSVLSLAATQRSSLADEMPANEIAATFVAPYGEMPMKANNSADFKAEIQNTDKKEVISIDFPEIGKSFLTLKITKARVRELESQGFELANPFSVTLFDAARCKNNPRIIKKDTTTTIQDVPANVCRVVGSPVESTYGPEVWVLDSGVDPVAVNSNLLNVATKVDCTQGSCVTGAVDDELGHGTMVAGIIGGRTFKDGSSHYTGLAGVSPKVALNIIKIFGDDETVSVWDQPLKAIRYVLDHAKAGDVVNISWGANFLEAARNGGYSNDITLLDNLFHLMADRKLRIVVAAGNAERANGNGWSWAQGFTPANSAPYTSPVSPGAIYSVSAADSKFDPMTMKWSDKLWQGSAFGASFAEPGVEVRSLWLSDDSNNPQQNVCWGTSFAAPILAGLLVRGSVSPGDLTDSTYPDADTVAYVAAGKSDATSPKHPKCN